MRRAAQPIVNSIPSALAQRRWSDEDLARAAGLSRSRVNRIKNGRAEARASEALRIAGALGMEVEQLFRLNLTVCAGDSILAITPGDDA